MVEYRLPIYRVPTNLVLMVVVVGPWQGAIFSNLTPGTYNILARLRIRRILVNILMNQLQLKRRRLK